jgi:hypothetical protein
MPLPRDFRPGPPDFPARSPFDFTEESIPEAIPVTDEAIPEAIPVTNESPLERYGRELGIGWKALSPVLIGGVCLLLLGLITLFPWASVQIGDKELEAYYGELLSETWTGLETSQGRVIGTVTVIAAGALGLGLFLVRRHLPACLLVAGASGTVSVILLFSYWRNVHARMAETAEYLNMPLMKSVGLGKLRGGIQSPFYVAVLLAIAVAATFVFASLLKPLKLPFLRNTGAGPLVEKHGGLIGAQALAVLIGLIFFVVFS